MSWLFPGVAGVALRLKVRKYVEIDFESSLKLFNN